MAGLVDRGSERILDAQPYVGFALDESCELQAFVEVKSRTRAREVAQGEFADDPISVYLTLRRYGPWAGLGELSAAFDTLAARAERLASDRVVPHVVRPIREMIYSSPE
jgi:hypothetical protein